MPKNPSGISRLPRVDLLRQILKRWGRLNKQQIDQHMAVSLDIDAGQISRTLYRDLETLVTNGEIGVSYYTRDGQEILDFDPDLHKSSYCEWYFKNYADSTLGGNAITEAGILLLCSPRLKQGISIHPTEGTFDEACLNLFLFSGGRSFCIKIKKDIAPVNFLVGRRPQSDSQPLLKLAEEQYGQRSILCLSSTPTLSSFDGQTKRGHFQLSWDGAQTRLRDLQSKNGTATLPIPRDQLKHRILDELSNIQVTLPKTPGKMTGNQKGAPRNLKSGSEILLHAPFLIQASDFFKIIIG